MSRTAVQGRKRSQMSTAGRRSRWHKCSAQALPLRPFQQSIPARPTEKLKPAESAPAMKTYRSPATPSCSSRGLATKSPAASTTVAPTTSSRTSTGSAVDTARDGRASYLGVLGWRRCYAACGLAGVGYIYEDEVSIEPCACPPSEASPHEAVEVWL